MGRNAPEESKRVPIIKTFDRNPALGEVLKSGSRKSGRNRVLKGGDLEEEERKERRNYLHPFDCRGQVPDHIRV